MDRIRVLTDEDKERIEDNRDNVPPAQRKRSFADVEDKEQRITDGDLEQLMKKAIDNNSPFLMQKYLEGIAKKQKQDDIEHAFWEYVNEHRDMTDEEWKIMAYDYHSGMSTFRLIHCLDIFCERMKHPTKCDKTPIFILVGETSCGKSKIALALAKSIGRCEFPITAYSVRDNLALSDWFNSGSDVLVFDDFNFVDASDPQRPSEIFNHLKQWASGVEIHFRTALSGRRKESDSFVKRKVKAIIISVNEIKRETTELVRTMPEMRDRFEYIVFGPQYSYDPLLNSNYQKKYENSSQIADRCLPIIGKYYLHKDNLQMRGLNFRNKMVHYGSLEEINRFEHFRSNLTGYPFANGLYNETIISFNRV